MHRIVLQEGSQAALQLGVQLQLHQAQTTEEIEPALQTAVTDRSRSHCC